MSLNKTGSPCVSVEEIRSISIQGHPRKVIELVIKNLLECKGSTLLESAEYQRGLKKGCSATSNLAEILGVVTEDVRKRNGMRSFLSVDLSRANDKVKREKLFKVLKSRAKTDVEKTAVALIQNMYRD